MELTELRFLNSGLEIVTKAMGTLSGKFKISENKYNTYCAKEKLLFCGKCQCKIILTR